MDSDNPRLLYVEDCPGCHQRIHECFSPFSGPVAFTHKRPGRKSCRLIVHPRHNGTITADLVPHNQSLETALSDALDRALREAA